MDASSRSRRTDQSRSGGKILRARRPAAARTPYDRPQVVNNSGPVQSPNWLARIIYPPTRLAGKLISSVFSPDSESSSSSSSSSGGDASSEDDIDVENNDNVISSPEAGRLEKKDGTSEMITYFRKESQPIVWKSETKRVIEQLLMHETFSREEGDRLINIIKSRVVDFPLNEDTKGERIDIDIPDPCSTAVLEAKKWIEEKKLDSMSKSDRNLGTCTVNSVTLPYVTGAEMGSPVDVAKSYMRARPPWASPSMSHIELSTPSPAGMQLFKDETPLPIGDNFLSSSKLKRDSHASGSWNILEEIRKVRSKATEEMLRTPPSRRIEGPSFALESKSSLHLLEVDILERSTGNKTHGSTKSIDASPNVEAGVTAFHDAPVSEMTRYGLQNDDVPAAPANAISQQNQDSEAARIIEKEEDAAKVQPSEDIKTVLHSDAGAGDANGLKDNKGTNQQLSSGGTAEGVAGASSANGFPSLASSFSAGLGTEQDGMPIGEENHPAYSSHDEIATNIPAEETCEILSEVFIEVPSINETDSIGDFLNNTSVHDPELSQDLPQPDLPPRLTDKKQQQKRQPTKYNRRGRGRSK